MYHVSLCTDRPYGHRATHCKHEEKCGKCGAEDHKTDACQSTVHTCCRCKGSHQAWSLKCPHRIAESQRLAALRAETSPYFTSGFNQFDTRAQPTPYIESRLRSNL